MEQISQPQYAPTPEETTDRERAEAWIETMELLRSKQQIMQTNAAKIYGISNKAEAAWQDYNNIISDLVARANAGELSDAELVQLQQFQKLTPPDFVAAISAIFTNMALLAEGIYNLDAGTGGKWIGVYRPEIIEPIEE